MGVRADVDGEAVMLLDLDTAVSPPPRAASGYECRGCPVARPHRYTLVGPSPLIQLRKRPYNVATDLLPGSVMTLSSYEEDTANILYSLDHDLRVVSAEPSDGYWSLAADDGDESPPHVVEIRQWTGTDWQASRMPLGRSHR
jgi:hypothetical protein